MDSFEEKREGVKKKFIAHQQKTYFLYMNEIPKHLYEIEWLEDIEIKIKPFEEILSMLGERMYNPHGHDFHQIIFIEQGTGTHEVDYHKIEMSAGSLIPVFAGQIHSFVAGENLKGFNIVFTSAFVAQDKAFSRLLHNFMFYTSMLEPECIQIDSDIIDLIKMVYRTFTAGNNESREEILRTYLRLIILKLNDKKSEKIGESTNEQIQLSLKFNEEIENHLNYQSRVADISEVLKVETKKLNSAIKATMKQTPKEVLTYRLTLELKRLLTYTDLSIKEIAHHMGFKDAANFSNYFKTHTSVSPSDFRTKTIKGL